MSTHNIGFYEDLTKIILQLSSNFIKYTPYLFFCQILPVNNPKGQIPEGIKLFFMFNSTEHATYTARKC